MTNDECRMTNEGEEMLNDELRMKNVKKMIVIQHSTFNIQHFSLFAVNIGEDFLLQGNGNTSIGIGSVAQFQSVGALITSWLPNIYILGGILVLILIIVSGFMWITNAGNIKKIEESQKILTFAIMGFVFLFASYWIIQIVQVLTGIPILGSGL